ncbi:MAG: nudF [Proteobacteria bacterium]|nr:nudF [Pseudomonadota bacterium]
MTDESHLREDQLDSEVVFDGRLLHVRRDRVRLPNGAESTREYITHPGAVTVLALLDNGKLLLERQFRYPLGRVFLELPAGKIDDGEQALVAAKRELLEETGYTADDWRNLGVMNPCIGYSDERIEIFLACHLSQVSGQQLDHNEFLDVLEMSPNEVSEAIRQGMITDAKTITALYWLEKVLRESW